DPRALTVDWIEKYLYWIEGNSQTIMRSTFNGSAVQTVLRSGMDDPRSLALLPCEKLVYWAQWGKRPSIKSVWTSGKVIKTVLNRNLQWPTGLTIDQAEGRIFWVDAKKDIIESSLLDGTDRKIIVSAPGITLRSIAVFGEFLYWTDPSTSNIKRVSK
ncbi:predicted protein, partial [Nematostella vectensis]